MNKLDELIQQLCPDGVEYKPLGQVCKLSRGKVYSKEYLQNNAGEYPVYSSQTANNGELGKINTYDCEGDFLTWTTDGAYAGTVFHRKGKFSITNVCGLISVCNPLLNIRFLYYWLTITAKAYVYQGMGNPKLMTNQIEVIPIPFPPLPVQEEVVRILDTFTESTNNLKEQIQTRRKQYEFYRNQLLDLEGKDVTDIVQIGDVCQISKGNGVQKADFVDCGVGCIHYGQIYTHYGAYTYSTNKFVSEEVFEKARKASKGDIIMTDTSENVEDICKCVAYLGNEDIAISNHTFIIKHKQNPKYLSFSTLTNSFAYQKRKYVVGAKVSCIKQEHLAKIRIYLPSLYKQNEIVSILDQFEASIANLEAQLKEREKQYEYYRNKLLDFKKKED